jgi:transposase
MKRQVACKPRAPRSERPAGPLAVQCLAVRGEDAMRFCVGLDWASTAHAVCLIDSRGAIRWQASVPHSAVGLAALVRRLRRWRQRGPLAIAVERPSGVLVDTLVQAGFDVVPIHPNVVKATRPRYSAAGGKSDPGDAFLLADLLRTDGHRFRPLQPPSDDTRALRTLVRGRDDLVAQRVALANQLRALLERVWPGAAQIFADVDSPITLAFLARYPTLHSAARLGEKRLAHFLVQHAYCGRRSAGELLARLHAAPPSQLGEGEAEAAGDLVRCLVAVLTPLVAQIQQLGAAIAAALQHHPDAPIVQTLPRGGTINAAQLLAELGDERRRFTSAEQLAAEAGVAPVTHASGKHRGVTSRGACNKRLRLALTTFADNSRHASAWAATVYQRALQRGCDHPHAIRILARAWVRVLWRCWQNRTPYDVTRHGAAVALAAA